MKYKVGDKVRIVAAWPEDGSAYQNAVGSMDKWLGKVMTIRSVGSTFYRMEEDRGENSRPIDFGGWAWNDACIAGLAEQAPDLDFKVGDRVVIVESNIEYDSKYAGLIGVIKEIDADYDFPCYVSTEKCPEGVWCKVKAFGPQKIVVTVSGATTTAKLYDGRGLVRSAEAKCSPDDTFDFETGAKLALDRLLGREEPPFKVGDFVRVTGGRSFGHSLPVGSVGRVIKVQLDKGCRVDGFLANGERVEQFVAFSELEKI